jgi:hypothetical protein
VLRDRCVLDSRDPALFSPKPGAQQVEGTAVPYGIVCPRLRGTERQRMRFPIYEHLYQLNRNLHETVEILERIRKSPGMNKKQFHAYQVEIEHLRAQASQDIAGIMGQIESKESFQLWKQRRAYETSTGDPDDVYFEVSQREEERRQKGLPPLIGILRGRSTRGEAAAKTGEPNDTPLAKTQRPSGKSKSKS